MIVYGVAADVSIAQLFVAGVLPGVLLALIFSGYIAAWSLLNADKIPPPDAPMSLREKLRESRSLIPVVLLIAAVLGSIYSGIATATEAAALGVVGSLVISSAQGSMSWLAFRVRSCTGPSSVASSYRAVAVADGVSGSVAASPSQMRPRAATGTSTTTPLALVRNAYSQCSRSCNPRKRPR